MSEDDPVIRMVSMWMAEVRQDLTRLKDDHNAVREELACIRADQQQLLDVWGATRGLATALKWLVAIFAPLAGVWLAWRNGK